MKIIIFTACVYFFFKHKVGAVVIHPKHGDHGERVNYVDDPKNPKVTVLTVPDHFGRSTILDMVKKFTSYKVDYTGELLPPTKNKMKDLFCSHPFNICKNQTFMDKHFGLYPTVSLNYKALKYIGSVKEFFLKMRRIVYKACKEHKYLALNHSLFETEEDRTLFLHHCSVANIGKITDGELVEAVKWLIELLYNHFTRQVIVLIDNYDVYWNSLLHNFNEDSEFIYRYLCGTNMAMFHKNPYLYKALIIGGVPLQDFAVNTENFRYYTNYYRFLGNHRFNKYFGFTEEDIDRFLRIVTTAENRKEKKKQIMLYYSGYYLPERNYSLFNPWSVLHYCKCDFETNFYWVWTQYLNNITMCYYIRNISDVIYDTFFERTVPVSHIDEPFELRDFVTLAKMSQEEKAESQGEIDLYFRLLFHLGFLIPVKRTVNNVTEMDYPNFEIHLELSRVWRLTQRYTRYLA